jgi:hypothetical protein
MNANVEMIISDSCFCRQIINKYKQGQRNSFGLPLMIFRKKAGRILGHNIHMNILLQLNPVDGKIVFSSILKSVQNMQGLFSWFGSEKCILQPIARSAMIKGFTCVNKVLPHISNESASQSPSAKDVSVGGVIYIRSIPSVFSRPENMIPPLKTTGKVRRPLLKIAKAVSHLHADFKELSSNFTVIRQGYNTTGIFQMINFDGLVKISRQKIQPQLAAYKTKHSIYMSWLKLSTWTFYENINFQTGKRRRFSIKGIEGGYPSSPEEMTGKIFPAFEYLSPAILSQVDFLLNKRTNEVSQNLVTGNKSFIKHHQYITGGALLFAPWEKRLFESLQLKKPMGQNLKINERKQSAGRINNETANPIVGPVNTVFKAESENFYFHSQRMIEKELNEIKKNIVETKEAVKEKFIADRSSMDMDIKQYLDINRLSDQVYRNIEQRIRIERERRGL